MMFFHEFPKEYFFIDNFSSFHLQSIFSEYIGELLLLPVNPIENLLLKLCGDLMEYLSSHSWDLDNILIGTSLPTSTISLLTPLECIPQLFEVSPSLSLLDSETLSPMSIPSSPPLHSSQTTLIRIFFADGSFKTIDVRGTMTVGDVSRKLCKMLRIRKNGGFLSIVKTIHGNDFEGNWNLQNRYRMIEVNFEFSNEQTENNWRKYLKSLLIF